MYQNYEVMGFSEGAVVSLNNNRNLRTSQRVGLRFRNHMNPGSYQFKSLVPHKDEVTLSRYFWLKKYGTFLILLFIICATLVVISILLW